MRCFWWKAIFCILTVSGYLRSKLPWWHGAWCKCHGVEIVNNFINKTNFRKNLKWCQIWRFCAKLAIFDQSLAQKNQLATGNFCWFFGFFRIHQSVLPYVVVFMFQFLKNTSVYKDLGLSNCSIFVEEFKYVAHLPRIAYARCADHHFKSFLWYQPSRKFKSLKDLGFG